jgi:serine/threonine protein kinase
VYLGYHSITKVDVAVKKFELSNNNKKIERRAIREIKY